MEDNDSHELRSQEKKAEEELSKLPESDKAVLAPVLDLQKQRNTLFLQFLTDLRALEYKYDNLYNPLYTQRFEIAKTTPEFWLKAMRNNTMIATMIFDQDFELLKSLIDIRHISEEATDNFTIEFHFTENSYMHNTVLTKRFIMGANDEPKKGEGCEIKWKGASLTQKIKKTKKRGKNKKVGTKVEEIPSFFLFFKTVTDEDEKEEDDEEDEMGDALEDDYETGCEFRDELIPNAVYYYLGVMEEDEDDDDSEDEPGEKKSKPKKVDGSGTEKADCKPQ